MEFPDLPGCLADGKTIEEAVTNASDALRSWLVTAKEFKDPAPSAWMSGKWVQRVPKSLHAKLAAKAEKEGVSLNTLVVSLITPFPEDGPHYARERSSRRTSKKRSISSGVL